MAWTAPRTWVTLETVTASIMNTHVRDNLLQAAPAKATTAGDLVYASGANALSRLAVGSAGGSLVSNGSTPLWRVTTRDGNTSSAGNASDTSYSGNVLNPYVGLDLTTGTHALVHWALQMSHSVAGATVRVAPRVVNDPGGSATETHAPIDLWSLGITLTDAGDLAQIGRMHLFNDLTSGTNRFELYWRCSTASGTVTFSDIELTVIPLS